MCIGPHAVGMLDLLIQRYVFATPVDSTRVLRYVQTVGSSIYRQYSSLHVTPSHGDDGSYQLVLVVFAGS